MWALGRPWMTRYRTIDGTVKAGLGQLINNDTIASVRLLMCTISLQQGPLEAPVAPDA